MSVALRELPHTRLDRLPRMADFVLLATAASPAFGWQEHEFTNIYMKKYVNNAQVTIENSLLGSAIYTFSKNQDQWIGTASELLEIIDRIMQWEIAGKRKPRGWPNIPATFSNRLTELQPALRKMGVNIIRKRKGGTGKRVIEIIFDNKNSLSQSSPSHVKPPWYVPLLVREQVSWFRAQEVDSLMIDGAWCDCIVAPIV